MKPPQKLENEIILYWQNNPNGETVIHGSTGLKYLACGYERIYVVLAKAALLKIPAAERVAVGKSFGQRAVRVSYS